MGILIQPLHAFIYMVFMIIASRIMTVAPVLSLLFIRYLEKSEKIVRNIFRLKEGIVTAGMNEAGNKVTDKIKGILK